MKVSQNSIMKKLSTNLDQLIDEDDYSLSIKNIKDLLQMVSWWFFEPKVWWKLNEYIWTTSSWEKLLLIKNSNKSSITTAYLDYSN